MRLLTILFLLTSFLQANAQSFNDITIKKDRASLETVFVEIEKQSEFRFFFNETLMKQAVPVTIDVKQVSLNKALDVCFEAQPKLTYAIVEKTIIVKRREVRVTDVSLGGKDFGRLAELRGIVASERGPVLAATVLVKGTDKATTTNNAGEFLLYDVDDKAVLVVTHVNHHEQEVRLNGKGLINILMDEKVGELDEQIVVAYNTRTKKNNVGAITVIKGTQIQSLPNRSFDKSLQGLVPGLLVTQGSGLPGGPVTNFVLRGIATATDPANGATIRNPLIVIDGVPVSQDKSQVYIDETRTPVSNPLAQLNPSDFETIAVLKDAAAISLYGSRASNGVIVITTKRGKSGKTTFNFRHQTDIASLYKGNIDLLSQDEYLELLLESYRNLNSPQFPTDAAVYAHLYTKFPVIISASGDTSFYPATNWHDILLRDNATTISNELSMSGGNEKNNFYLNLEYLKQNGIVVGTGFDRKSLRFNFENRPTNWLKLGLNTTLSYSIQDYGGGTRGTNGTVADNMSPLNPVRYANGDYVMNFLVGGGVQNASLYANPAAAAEFNTNRNTAYRGLTNFNLEITFLKHFKFNSIAGLDFMLAEAKEKADPRLVDPGNFSTAGIGRIEQRDERRATVVSTNILRYTRNINVDHSIDFLFGQEAQIQNQKEMLIAVQNLGLPYYDQISSPGVTPLRQLGLSSRETLLSYFSQANYGFRSKYFLSASVRRDGSSRFGEDKRYGTYWSTGASWVISEEGFMKAASSWIDYLKIRGSIGAAGNAASINAFTRFDKLDNYTYLGGIALVPTETPGNPDVQWEQTFTWDAGIEAQFWNRRISITLDIYQRKTRDLIYPINLPASTGYFSILKNIGKMENRGIEASISAQIVRNKNFTWIIDANWSTNKNKLVKADVPTAALLYGALGTKEGENFNSFFLPVWAGVNPIDGKAQWLDSEGNIVTSYPSGVQHRKFVGKPQPDGFGSASSRIRYKAFELSASFFYQYGYQLYVQNDLVSDGRYPYMNQDRRALDRWQKPGDVASNPRRVLNNSNGSAINRPSTRYLFDGDHIRLQNATIAWYISENVTNRLRLSKMKIYVQGNNLAIWTIFPGQDPDIVTRLGTTATSSFPSQRTFSFGLNVIF